MCGLAGILAPGGALGRSGVRRDASIARDQSAAQRDASTAQRDASTAEREARVRAMMRALGARGPDSEGFFADGAIALGFRRLAVIDLATGDQPIRLEQDRAVMVLNGEIYNYRELRRELEGKGHTFRTSGDVEVALRLLVDQGLPGLRRLNGMFAFALWEPARSRLLLGRDRHGIKPLFLCRQDGALAFASEVSALLAAGFPRAIDIDGLELRHTLAQKYPSPAGSLIRGITALAPATVLEIGPEGERVHRYWEPPEQSAERASAHLAAADVERRLEHLLREAVVRQLVADVPVGLFLSGGVDSGTLTALVCASGAAGTVRTFSVGFEGEGAVNELDAARATATALGTEHHELIVGADDVARDLDRILAGLDGPLADPTAIPTWYMSRYARGTVTVALSGEGADELFAGYPRQRLDAWLDRVPGAARPLLPAGLKLAGRRVGPRLARRLTMPPSLARQLDWSRLFTAAEIDELGASPLPGEGALLALQRGIVGDWEQRARQDALNARLETDRLLFLPGDLLPKVDRMSMAHGLEVRVPYLDDEVVDFVVPLPGTLKVRGTRDKALLRDVADRVLPGAARRRKQGFFAPIGGWLRGPLRAALTDLLAPNAVRARGLFRPEPVEALVRAHLESAADHGEKLWALVALEGWLQSVERRREPLL